MNDKTLARFVERFPANTPADVADEEPEENLGAFGHMRGVRDRALMLEFRLKDGGIVALSYTLLDRASFDPSEGIRLRFSGQEVHVVGQALNEPKGGTRLFDALLRHRVTWIQEAGRADLMDARTGVTLVESIVFDN